MIEGAAEGAGLGHQFLKHLSRNRLLLHVLDCSPYSDSQNPIEDFLQVSEELRKYDDVFARIPRWLVLNKMDLLSPEEQQQREDEIVTAIAWQGPVYRISAHTGMGTEKLCGDIMQTLEQMKADAAFLGKSPEESA